MGGMGQRAAIVDERQLQRDNHKLIAVLAVLVALITGIALMLPALSLTRGELVCGMEARSHTSELTAGAAT